MLALHGLVSLPRGLRAVHGETAADRNAVKGRIAALGDKKSRPKAAEQKEDKYGHKMEDVEPVTQ